MQARLTLKIQFENEIRRLSVEQNTLTWEGLQTLVKSLFSAKTEAMWAQTTFSYVDDEGDKCTIGSDVELQEAISLTSGSRPLLKLSLSQKEASPQEAITFLQQFFAQRPPCGPFARFGGPSRFGGGPHFGGPRFGQDHPRREGHKLHAEGIALMESKEYVAARAKFVEQLEMTMSPWHRSVPLYNIACCDALLGNSESALQFLEQCVQSGYHDAEHMKADKDLESLRGLEQYEVLISKLSESSSGSRCSWSRPSWRGKQEWFGLQQQALSLLEIGSVEALTQARELLQKQLQQTSGSWARKIPLYNLACCEALLGNTSTALEFLRNSVNAGYRNLKHIEKDEDLKSLRELDEFKVIIASLKSGHRCRRWENAAEEQEKPQEEPAQAEQAAQEAEQAAQDEAQLQQVIEQIERKDLLEQIEQIEAIEQIEHSELVAVGEEAEESEEIDEKFEGANLFVVVADMERFSAQLEVLSEMGFGVWQDNLKALQTTNGNVSEALTLLLA